MNFEVGRETKTWDPRVWYIKSRYRLSVEMEQINERVLLGLQREARLVCPNRMFSQFLIKIDKMN